MAPDSLVCHITDGSVPTNVTLEGSVPSQSNPASTPAPCATTNWLTEVPPSLDKGGFCNLHLE